MSDKLTTEAMQMLSEWQQAANQLAHFKAIEMELRKNTIAVIFADTNVAPGTHKFPIANGYTAKIMLKETIKLDANAKEKLPTVYAALRAAGVDASVADALIKTEISLSETNYKKLSEAQKLIVADIVTVKPASPTLEIEAPKVAS